MKSNAEKQKQRNYRERKKLEVPDFLERERKRQKENYEKTFSFLKKELQEKNRSKRDGTAFT